MTALPGRAGGPQGGAEPAAGVDPALPVLHGRPPTGWLNDPNGVSHIDGRWHVYYQYNPSAPVHTDIHWGHMSSPDLLHWTTEPVALAPRPGRPDAGGVWSGTMVIDGGVPTAVYTGIDEHQVARALLARGDRDARVFTRDEPPAAEMPSDGPITDLRDPYPLSVGGRRWMIQGAGWAGGIGSVLIYDADDLTSWVERGELLRADHPALDADVRADIWECPNLLQVDGRWVLLVSVWRHVPDRSPLHHVSWIVGELIADDHGVPRFEPSTTGRLDQGSSYYAAQGVSVDDRVLVWGWSPETDLGSDRLSSAPWQGVLTHPRELRVVDGAVCSTPAAELIGLRAGPADPDALPAAFEVETRGASPVRLMLDGVQVWGDDVLVQRVLVDGSLVEVFAADGSTATVRAYPHTGSRWEVQGTDLAVHALAVPTL